MQSPLEGCRFEAGITLEGVPRWKTRPCGHVGVDQQEMKIGLRRRLIGRDASPRLRREVNSDAHTKRPSIARARIDPSVIVTTRARRPVRDASG